MAISTALQVLGYFELPKAEVPDENIWHHPERLEEWWEAVEQRRKDGLQPVDSADDGDMTQNEFARGLRGD